MKLLLNCDLGESVNASSMSADQAVMPYIDQANIACGFHAGNPLVIQQTLALAKQHKVAVGAHPSYPDLAGFGRRSIACTTEELHALLTYQIAALDGMAHAQGLQLQYVKPHGALYNDMMHNQTIRQTVMTAIATYHKPLSLMLQATTAATTHHQEAEHLGLTLLFEAFADRRYGDDGLLLPRNQAGAVLNTTAILAQVTQLVQQRSITTVSGNCLPLRIDTLCVHGDNPDSVDLIKQIRQLITQSSDRPAIDHP